MSLQNEGPQPLNAAAFDAPGQRVSPLEKGKKFKQHETKLKKAKAAARAPTEIEKKKRWTPERLRETADGEPAAPQPRRRRMILKKRGESDADLAARTPKEGTEAEVAPSGGGIDSTHAGMVAKGPTGTRGFVWPETSPARFKVYMERKTKEDEAAAAELVLHAAPPAPKPTEEELALAAAGLPTAFGAGGGAGGGS